MQQLSTPNPNVPYFGGLCQGFVEGTVGQATPPEQDKDGNWMTYGVYPTASAAWANPNGNRPGELPPAGLSVPVYFSLGSTSDGHVALMLPDGRVASSTQGGYHSTAYIHPNLDNLIAVYAQYNSGCTYLGWKEDIGNLKVVGENMPDRQDVINQFAGFCTDVPTEEQIQYYMANPWSRLNEDLLVWNNDRRKELTAQVASDSSTITQLQAEVAAAAAQTPPAPVSQPTEPVPQPIVNTTPKTGVLNALLNLLKGFFK